MEILMVTGLLAYIMNYIIGKNKNSRLAQAWFNSHRELLESNFALVGEHHFCSDFPDLSLFSFLPFHLLFKHLIQVMCQIICFV